MTPVLTKKDHQLNIVVVEEHVEQEECQGVKEVVCVVKKRRWEVAVHVVKVMVVEIMMEVEEQVDVQKRLLGVFCTHMAYIECFSHGIRIPRILLFCKGCNNKHSVWNAVQEFINILREQTINPLRGIPAQNTVLDSPNVQEPRGI